MKSKPPNLGIKDGKAPFLKPGLAMQKAKNSFKWYQSEFPVTGGVRDGLISSFIAPDRFLTGWSQGFCEVASG